MKLIFIYGPPAAGKLTVATELSKLTGYKLFHNHLTTDLIRSIFEHGNKHGTKLIDKYRLELIEAAAKHNINFIFTYVYEKTVDDWFVDKVVKSVEKHKGKVCFVRLDCSQRQLKKRVEGESRKGFHKIKDLETLEGLLKECDVVSSISKRKSFVIDNSKLPPKTVATQIAAHFKLLK